MVYIWHLIMPRQLCKSLNSIFPLQTPWFIQLSIYFIITNILPLLFPFFFFSYSISSRDSTLSMSTNFAIVTSQFFSHHALQSFFVVTFCIPQCWLASARVHADQVNQCLYFTGHLSDWWKPLVVICREMNRWRLQEGWSNIFWILYIYSQS